MVHNDKWYFGAQGTGHAHPVVLCEAWYAHMLRGIVFGGGVIVQLAAHAYQHNVTHCLPVGLELFKFWTPFLFLVVVIL